MARPRQQRGRGLLRLVAAAVLLMALLSLCLARVDAAADSHAVAGRDEWKKGVVAAVENVIDQEAAAAEGEEGPVVPERVAIEIADYAGAGANSKHLPHP
uniref:Uncharacterized protein n=1 Tax=Arundo donax TaxID=35708 RepID=A0A0A8YEL8_ARUDO